MLGEAITFGVEYVAGLGLDIGKEHFAEKIDEKKLKAALESYIASQKKYNEISTLTEEMDFQGLIDYIKTNLLNAVSTRVFSVNSKQSGRARDEIVNAAIAYAKAETEESRKRVSKVVCICVDMIRDFYRQKISKSDYILAAEVVDAVAEKTTEIVATETTKLSDKLDEIEKIVENVQAVQSKQQMSLENAVQLVRTGDLTTINRGFQKLLGHMSLEHPLYPDYGFNWNTNRFVSQPQTAEAMKKYPPRFKFKGAIRSGDQYFNDPNIDVGDYAYRHQLTLTMEIDEAKKYLGDIPDPDQYEAESLVGKTLHAKPPEFPPAFPCAIKIKDKIYFHYVLMRTQEILDDGTYIFSNYEQTDSHIRFEFRFKLDEIVSALDDTVITQSTNFSISVKDPTTEDLLKFVRFMSSIQNEKEITISVLSVGCDLLSGKIDNVSYKTGFSSVEEEIDFLERLFDIEKYFNVVTTLDGEISADEYKAVIGISELLRKESIEGTWSELTFNGIVDDGFRERLKDMNKEMKDIAYVGTQCVNLFGAEFEFRHMLTYKSTVIKDFDRVIQLAELLEDGENIKITLLPGSDNTVTDTIHVPEETEVL